MVLYIWDKHCLQQSFTSSFDWKISVNNIYNLEQTTSCSRTLCVKLYMNGQTNTSVSTFDLLYVVSLSVRGIRSVSYKIKGIKIRDRPINRKFDQSADYRDIHSNHCHQMSHLRLKRTNVVSRCLSVCLRVRFFIQTELDTIGYTRNSSI